MSVQTVARRYASALADVVLKNGQTREVQEELTRRGHHLRWMGEYDSLPWMETAAIDPVTGRKQAAMDPRHNRDLQGGDDERGTAGQQG